MPQPMKELFSNKRISPRKRVLSPFFSAIVSFFLPGAAQAINGQVLKGVLIMLFWLALTSTANWKGTGIYEVIKVAQYILMAIISSDAYFIASRMKLGEEVRRWSVMFFHMEAPSEASVASAGRADDPGTLIKNAWIIDGTGIPAFQSDVLLQGKIIRYIRHVIEDKNKDYSVIDAEGCVLIPGAINPACCAESRIFSDAESTGAVRQGFTTEILGQYGYSLAPVRETERINLAESYAAVHGRQSKGKFFDNVGMYLMSLERLPTLNRFESLIGYGTLRRTVLESDEDFPSPENLQRVMQRIGSGLKSGAKGVSINMEYAPCMRIGSEELMQVMKTVTDCNGIISLHLPVTQPEFLSALDRVCQIAEKLGGGRLLFVNMHALGADRDLGKVVSKKIADLKKTGIDVEVTTSGLPTLVAGAASSVASGLLIKDGDAFGVVETADEEFCEELFSNAGASPCTDNVLCGSTDYTLPYYLGHYVMEKNTMSMEEAVRRCTSRQSAFWEMWDRGMIREGMTADLTLLRPAKLPSKLEDGASRGISKVWVEGSLRYNTEPDFDIKKVNKPRFFGLRMEP